MRGARRRLSSLWISNCNLDIKTRWLNPREEFDGFDLLLNFQFVFSHLVTFGRRLLDSVLLVDFVLDLFVHAHGFLSWPPLGPPPGPPPEK